MSVLTVKEMFEGRDGQYQAIGQLAVTRQFLVTTDSAYDDANTLLASGMLPAINSPHPVNNRLLARVYRPRQRTGTAFHWDVAVEYNNQILGQIPSLAQEIQPNPLLRRTRIRGKTIHNTVPLEKAPLVDRQTISGWNNGAGAVIPSTDSPIETSSCEVIEGAEKFCDQFAWEVETNVDVIPTWILGLNNKMNAAALTLLGLTLPKFSVMLRGLAHSDLNQEQVSPYVFINYYTIRFDLHFRSDLWFKGYPDRGFYEIVDGKQRAILDKRGSPVAVPALLDGLGRKLASPTADTTVYNWFAPAPPADFSNIQTLLI